uniref:NADH-ubiquinone oxidoreductase chain 1 n=1 Tax=Pachyphlegyas modiglianii TaxID=2816051 RepID=A0A8T9ZWL9_9HEMI|nr:NADH dehydrogenase subunit 1 [Pachyphlegyas modiglianii]
MVIYLLNFLVVFIFILLAVGFVTLLERKVLGYTQSRKGPNKVGILGLMQPFSDGMKLFMKEQAYLYVSNYLIYYFSPIFMLVLSLMIWLLMPQLINVFNFNLGLLFFLCCGGMGVYGIMMTGWSSNSNYSLLGMIRGIAQTISYEVSMTFILLFNFMLILSYNLLDFFYYQFYTWFMFLSLPLFFSFLISCLAETNRAPFDFAEGESELVSGFNVEYMGAGFSFIFLSEYMNIVFMSLIMALIYLGGNINSIFFYGKIVMLIFWFIWVRSSLPRYRYDKLMYLTWKMFLPMSLNYLFFVSMIMSTLLY